MVQEGFAVFPELVAEGVNEGADLFLTRFPSCDFLFADGGVFLGAGGEVLEAALVVEPGEAFGAGFEVQPEQAGSYYDLESPRWRKMGSRIDPDRWVWDGFATVLSASVRKGLETGPVRDCWCELVPALLPWTT
jgi:hypothetical protein